MPRINSYTHAGQGVERIKTEDVNARIEVIMARPEAKKLIMHKQKSDG